MTLVYVCVDLSHINYKKVAMKKKQKNWITSPNKKNSQSLSSAPSSSGQAGDPKTVANPIWLKTSEAAKIGGIKTKTIRRGIKSGALKYKIISNKYYIELRTLILFLHKTTKLKNKLYKKGLGQYIKKWFN